MAQASEKIRINTIIPFFNLPSTKGRNIKTWDYKQRKHLVIYIFDGVDCSECRDTLKKFAENYIEYRRLNAEVLAIGKDSIENLARLADELNLPYPVLADPGAEAINGYTSADPNTGAPYPSIFVADKFGSLEQEWVVEDENELPAHDQLLSLLHLLELRCPE